MARVAVILHERLGTWSAQLRPRLRDRPVHWIETRSRGDLDQALVGLAHPVILIDLRRNVEEGLVDLFHIKSRTSDALVLMVDSEAHKGVAALARELGATHVLSGFVPPPEVASLIDRWINLAEPRIKTSGWARPLPANEPLDLEEWLQIE
jgi:chemotaxis response regulator CheB